MASDGSLTFSTAIDNSGLEAGLKKAESRVDSLKNKIEKEKGRRSAISEQLEEATNAAETTKTKIREIQDEITRLNTIKEQSATAGADPIAYIQADTRLSELSSELKELEEVFKKQSSVADRVSGTYNTATRNLKMYCAQLRIAKQDVREYSAALDTSNTAQATQENASKFSALQGKIKLAMANAASLITTKHTKAATVVSSVYKKAASQIKMAFKTVIPFVTIATGIRLLLNNMKEFILQNQRAAEMMNGLKASAKGFANGLASVFMPAILGFIRIVTSMIMTLARIIDAIFKTSFVSAIQSAISSYGAASSGAGKQAKATDKLAKSLKEANRQLMAFDELNVLNADQENDNADNLDDVGSGGGGIDNAIVDGIDAALAKIMLMAGAALIAIGLILAFTGHIAIGVSLIAIGALMMYTAYSEQWDKLPEQVQEQLLGILQIVAGALIVIGVILLLFGQIPLGLGFIVAGATIFAITAVMGEGSLEGLVEAFHENILGIIAGALIVIGIILCVTGVALPIGIALIAVGALLFVGQEVLSWNTMSDEMKGFVSTALRIIAGALVVLGVILCITGMIPLGIAAIVVGITIFVAQAALNEKNMPSKIEEFFAKAIPILAGALVVIGIVLLLTGVGIALGIAAIIAGIAVLSVAEEKLDEDFIPDEVESFMNDLLQFIKDNAEFLLVLGIILLFCPVTLGLGIACIVAGIAGMVMPEDYDFNALKDQISDVWDSIVDWWHDNVAHIFTIEFWEGVFSSIADGLWGALSSAGEAINGFFSDIGNGIAGLAADIGIGFEIGIPQVSLPFLAGGAVIPPNRSFLAVLGDQTAGRNLEAPEGLIRQIVREESGGGGTEILVMMQELLSAVQEGKTLYVDGQVLGQTARRELATMERMGGY